MILPTCKEVSTAFAHGEFSTAPPLRRLGMQLHLLVCWHCRRFRRQMELIEMALKTVVFPLPDSARTDALKRTLLDHLKG